MRGKAAPAERGRFAADPGAARKFGKPGKYTVACRVQDNLVAEAIKAIELKVEK